MRKTLVLSSFPEKVEGTRDWKSCKQFVAKFIYDHFGLQVEIERAHRGTKVIRPQAPTSTRPRSNIGVPMFIELLRWEMADEIVKRAPSVLKYFDIPLKRKCTGLSSSSWSHRKFTRKEEMHLW